MRLRLDDGGAVRAELPNVLAVAGADRRRAALEIVKLLGPRFLDTKRGEPWRDELVRAAGIE